MSQEKWRPKIQKQLQLLHPQDRILWQFVLLLHCDLGGWYF